LTFEFNTAQDLSEATPLRRGKRSPSFAPSWSSTNAGGNVRMALNAQQRVQLGTSSLLIHRSAPLVLWREETIAISFTFTRNARAIL
jgi:hypothetical protein